MFFNNNLVLVTILAIGIIVLLFCMGYWIIRFFKNNATQTQYVSVLNPGINQPVKYCEPKTTNIQPTFNKPTIQDQLNAVKSKQFV